MRLGKVIGGIGWALIWVGSIVLLFVAYQLWGTNLAEARAQDSLESEFEQLLADADAAPATSTTTSTTSTPGPTSTTTTTAATAPPPPPGDGDAIARIVIPAIGVDKIVIEGVGRGDLRKGPGHYPDTPLPGQPGNAAIAGHRTTYGAPFNRVDELVAGDEILVTTLQGSFRYEVASHQIVTPSEVAVVADQGDDRLTLTSCHPKYSARQRIVVTAMLVDEPVRPPPTVPAPPDEDEDEDEDDEVASPSTLPADGDDDGDGGAVALDSLDGEDERTAGPAIVWGGVALAVWIAFFVLSRRWRRIPAYLLGAPVFGVALFVFFGALSEILPSNF